MLNVDVVFYVYGARQNLPNGARSDLSYHTVRRQEMTKTEGTMKKNLLFLATLFLLAGCEEIGMDSNGRYKTEKDLVGNILILDTKKGDVEIIQNGIRAKVPDEAQASGMKKFRSIRIPGMPVEITDLKIKYRDGMLYYQGNIEPIIKPISKTTENQESNVPSVSEQYAELFPKLESVWDSKDTYNTRSITIFLNDADNFEVTEFTLNRGDLTRVVNSEAEPRHFSFSSSKKINLRNYIAISDYNFVWRLAKWPTE